MFFAKIHFFLQDDFVVRIVFFCIFVLIQMVKGTYEIVCSYPCFLIQCFSYPHVFSTCFSYTPLHPPCRKITWIMDPKKNYAVADGFLVQQSCDFQVLCVRFFQGSTLL